MATAMPSPTAVAPASAIISRRLTKVGSSTADASVGVGAGAGATDDCPE